MSIELAGLLIAAATLVFGGTIKGAVGIGLPLIAVPVLAALYSPTTAIAVMVIPLIASNAWQLWIFRAAGAGRTGLVFMLLGCVVGVSLGTILLGVLSEAWLGLMIALVIFGYLGLRLGLPGLILRPAHARTAAMPIGLVAGVLQGATGISGPIFLTFVHAQRLSRETHIFVLSAIFTVLSVTQMLSLSIYGLMTGSMFLLSAACLAPIFLGMTLGQYLGRKLGQIFFERLTVLVLAITAVTLVARALPQIV